MSLCVDVLIIIIIIIKRFESKKVSSFIIFFLKQKIDPRMEGEGGERERERFKFKYFFVSYRTHFVRPDAHLFSVLEVTETRRTLRAQSKVVGLRVEVEHGLKAGLHGEILF